MKTILAAAGLAIVLAAPAYAQGMTPGSETSGAPVTSGVQASAPNPNIGSTPSGARSHAKGKAAHAKATHAKAYSKKKKQAPMEPSATPGGGAPSGSSGY